MATSATPAPAEDQDVYKEFGGSAAPPPSEDVYAEFGGHHEAVVPPPTPSKLSRVWDATNKGIISGNKILAEGDPNATPETANAIGEHTRNALTDIQRNPSMYDSPLMSGIKSFGAGVARDTADTASALTSPLSIATMGIGAAGKIPGAAGRVLRAVSGLGSLGFAGYGTKMAAPAVEDIYKQGPTPENTQAALLGSGMAAGGAAGVAESGIPKTAGTAIVKTGSKAVDLAKTGARTAQTVWNPVKYMGAEDAATRAFRPRNSKANYPAELQTALPDAKRAATNLGIDMENMTLDDAHRAIGQAKKDVWGEYQNNHSDPVKGLQGSTDPVAKAITNTISSRMRSQSPGLVKRIESAANDYSGKNMSMQEIEDRVQELNNKTRSIEAKYVADKRAAKLAPENQYLFAERDTLKQILVDKMDKVTGPGAADLRKRYGNLSSVEDTIQRRMPVADRQAPINLPETLARIYGGAKIAGGILSGNPLRAAEGLIALKTASNTKAINDPDFLTQQAFRQTTATPPATLNASSPKALPPAGPVITAGGAPIARPPAPAPRGTFPIAVTPRPMPIPPRAPVAPPFPGYEPPPPPVGGPMAESGRAPVSGATPMVPSEEIASPTPALSMPSGTISSGRPVPSNVPAVVPKLPPKLAVPPAVPAEMFNQRLRTAAPAVRGGTITQGHVEAEKAFFNQARTELGANASVSEVASRAQQLKEAGASPSRVLPPQTPPRSKLNLTDAIEYLRYAGGNKDLARTLAQHDGKAV